MSAGKPIKIHIHGPTPNPWKVVIVAEELNIPYELISGDEIKKEPFLSLSPNGRLPVIEDPNTGITLWESGAIIEYLVEEYDKEHKLSYTTFPEKYTQNVWKHFQMSGQGPYFGQKMWFSHAHHEKLPSAIDRYAAEVRRIYGVIELHLDKTGTPYLVGEKCTFADLMFIPWNMAGVHFAMEDFAKEFEDHYPKTAAWQQSMRDRQSVQRVVKIMNENSPPHFQHKV